ncbi:MAG TPA: DUF1501 domain-containing protein, partial [Isosphaeraceae bacterium]|nr:DUF1501 domain-containing protein [Isosphaeraceae bacterium]
MIDRVEPHARAVNRRQLLRIGGLGALGVNLASVLRAEAGRAAGYARSSVQSCILVFYYGGPSHHDTWDMKPHAPREVRGEFDSIATSVPGTRVSEHLPHCARMMHRLTVVRSVHHPMSNHNSAAFQTLCGRTPQKGDLELLSDDRNDPPCIGSSVSYSAPSAPDIPAFVALPHVMHNVVVLPGQSAGFLGSAYEPLQVSRDPNAADFRLSELELPGEISLDRLDHRQSLLREVEPQLRRSDALAAASSIDTYSEQAFRLLRSPAVRRAFDLSREDPRLRDRYGRTKHGQSMLLARRLVESGVRFVSVYDKDVNGLDNWDTHVNNFGRLKDQLLPPVDQALATLVEDLADR